MLRSPRTLTARRAHRPRRMSEEPIARREVLSKVLGASALFTAAAANAEIDYAGVGFLGGAKTIDVNNANVRVYQKLPGVYPNAAGKIVSGAPYKSKEDMYSKAGFSSAESAAVKKVRTLPVPPMPIPRCPAVKKQKVRPYGLGRLSTEPPPQSPPGFPG